MTPFDWSQYLSLAMTVRVQPGGEAAERCAISRAYYACYNIALAYADARGYAYVKGLGGSHAQVWKWYKVQARRRSNLNYRYIGDQGFRLHQRRIFADYRSVYPAVTADATLTLLEANQLLARIHQLPL